MNDVASAPERAKHELTLVVPGEMIRQATDIAGVCKEIVTKTAVQIQRRKYVRVEGWMSIATAHGCVASSRDVEQLADGSVRAIGEIRRLSDGVVLATAEGYVGSDEERWTSGPRYAMRAMAQTRAISRVCRTAFAHVVIMIDSDLSTTPAEEVPYEGFGTEAERRERASERPPEPIGTPVRSLPPRTTGSTVEAELDAGGHVHVPRETSNVGERAEFEDGKWQEVKIHFGSNYKGIKLGDLSKPQLKGWLNWQPKPYNGKIGPDDLRLRTALDVAAEEQQ